MLSKGESQPEVAESWLNEMEKIFMAINCAETNKVRLASYMLQDQADTWWRAALRTTFAGQKDQITWDEFLVAFRDSYFRQRPEGSRAGYDDCHGVSCKVHQAGEVHLVHQ